MPGRDRRGVGGDLVVGLLFRLFVCVTAASSPAPSGRWGKLCRCCGCRMDAAVRAWRAACGWQSWCRSRRRRWGAPVLEVEDVLGEDPRLASHSDMRAPLVLLFSGFRKPLVGDGAASTSAGLVSASFSLAARCAGAGDGRWFGSGGADFPQGLRCNIFLDWGLSAMCTDLRIRLGISVLYVRTLYCALTLI